jgi:hypothetical protein
MPNKSKRKGDSEERAIVNLHRELNIPVKRTLESGKRSDGSETYDIDLHVFGLDNAPLTGECKLRGSGFSTLYKFLGQNDWLSVRADRKERLYVLPERVWLRLIKAVSI